MIHYLKRYPFSLLVICAIFYLSLCTMPQTEMEDIPFIDKWVHLCMYGGLCGILWLEYTKSHLHLQPMRVILLTIVFPLIMSGSIELLQAYCTTTRNGDWLDMAANSIGVILGAVVGYFAIVPFLRRKKK